LFELVGRLERFLLIETKGIIGNLRNYNEALENVAVSQMPPLGQKSTNLRRQLVCVDLGDLIE
jgi:hypothetical protein